MRNILEVIRRRKMENIILKFMIIVVLSITIILNSNTYKEIFQDENLITSKNGIDKAINENKQYATLDLTNAELVQYSLENTKTKKKEINTYKIVYDNDILLVFLRNNTAITNKVKGEFDTFANEQREIKKKVMEENIDKNVLNISFSNVNYDVTENIIRAKFIFSTALFCLLTVSIFLDIYYYLNPRRTHMYKKYKKKSISK